MADHKDNPVYKVRPFKSGDQAACRKLYVEGLIGGAISDNDTALDMDDVKSAYLTHPGSHFWVACLPQGEVVGMVGVQSHEAGEGEIRRLRVQQDHQGRGIGSTLMETAVKFCSEHQYLKVMLDTFVDREPAIRLFEKFHFKLSRSRDLGEKTLLYFYLDIYSTDQKPKKS